VRPRPPAPHRWPSCRRRRSTTGRAPSTPRQL
jgi:hypothetical protein